MNVGIDIDEPINALGDSWLLFQIMRKSTLKWNPLLDEEM